MSTDQISDMLEHADEYQHLLDLSSYRLGLEDGVVAAFAALQREADEGEGPAVVSISYVAQGLGLDGILVVGRVAEAIR